MITGADKHAFLQWENYRKNLISSTPVPRESAAEKKKRIDFLLANPEEFYKYYFPKYATAEPARFHKKATTRLVEHDVWFEVRAWARDHAKSVRAMMEVLYLKFTGNLHNLLLVSYNETNAKELLMPVMIQLEANQRIINDYGIQKGVGTWEIGKFKTTDGVSFRAIGSGQNPRGTRNEEARPDFIWVDDLDDDELCRNASRLDEAYKWLMGALYACFDIKGTKRFLMVGNIIAKQSLIVRAAEKADYFDKVNILDSKGVPSWKERYTLEECQYMIDKLGYILSQREYFNNPIIQGSIFKNINYRKPLPLNQYASLVCYTDPSFKSTSNNDFKATALVGKRRDGSFDVIKAYLEQTTVKRMVEWHYEINDWVNGRAVVFYYMEANFIQDVLLEEFSKMGAEKGMQIPIKGDLRKKPDKAQRIEGLEPYFSRSQFFFNEDEKANPGMKQLVEQFEAFQRGSKVHDDGPDAVEGAVFKANEKTRQEQPIIIGRRHVNSRRV